VRLSWIPNTEPFLDKYRVYRGQSQTGPFVMVAEATGTAYSDGGLVNNTTYYYQITAVGRTGLESDPSAVASATPGDVPPAAPTGLTATPVGLTVLLQWAASPEPDVTRYRVYRSTTGRAQIAGAAGLVLDIHNKFGVGEVFRGGPYVLIREVTVPATSWVDSGLTEGVEYWYRVSAVDATGNESPQCAEVGARPNLPPPTPANLRVTGFTKTSISLAWNAVSAGDLAGYNLYRGTVSGDPNPLKVNGATPLTVTTFTDTTVSSNITYYYRVKAVDTWGGESAYSNEVAAAARGEPAHITLTSDKTTLSGNGIDSALLRATVTDADDAPVAGVEVEFTASVEITGNGGGFVPLTAPGGTTPQPTYTALTGSTGELAVRLVSPEVTTDTTGTATATAAEIATPPNST